MTNNVFRNILGCATGIFAALGLNSCIKDDNLSNCPDPFSVRIEVQIDAQTRAGSGVQIDNTHLYIFDENETFIAWEEGGSYVEGEPYEFYPDLGEGTYHFVIWSNQGDVYKANKSFEECRGNGHTLSELLISMECAADNCVRGDIPDLHHGIYRNAQIVKNTDNVFGIKIVPNTNIINIEVKGLEECTDDYGFTITDNNTVYNFDNSIASCDNIRYTRTANFTDSRLGASLKVLQLGHDRSPLLEFGNAAEDEPLFTGDLVHLIKTSYTRAGKTVDFGKVHVFDIVITFETDMSVTVTVNGWAYNEDDKPIG